MHNCHFAPGQLAAAELDQTHEGLAPQPHSKPSLIKGTSVPSGRRSGSLERPCGAEFGVVLVSRLQAKPR